MTQNRSETENLASRISKVRGQQNAGRASQSQDRLAARGAGRGFRLASEFVAAIVVGALLGIGLDAIFGTSPWIAVAMLLAGFAAGVLNVIRASRELNGPAPQETAPLDNDD